jgi:RHS repeat-associated protein
MGDGKRGETMRKSGATRSRAVLLGCMVGIATLASCAAASGATESDRARVVTPCLRAGRSEDIAPACAKAVARARAFVERSGGGRLSIAPSAPARSIAASPLVEGDGNSLEIKEVGDGSPNIVTPFSYNNGESRIYCGDDPALQGGETYASCAKSVFKDAVTGEKAPANDESIDTEFDACGKVVGASRGSWETAGTPGEVTSGLFKGGNDEHVAANQGSACSGIWTVVYSYTQTFTNKGTLTAEASGTFIVNVPPDPRPEELYGPNNPGAPNYAHACSGKPVNCATGNETVSQTDLSTGGRGIPLTLTRTYNAQAAVAQSTPGLLGYGWSSSFSDHLSISSTEGISVVTVVQANGSTVTFNGNGNPGALIAPKWAQAKLVLNGDGSYTYTLPTQETFHFDSSGRLLSEADRDGNATTLNRNAEGRLESVTDAAGRKMTLTYNSEGMIGSVKDPMGQTVKYTYEAGNLTSVTLPGESSPKWQFKYDGSHRLTKATDGRGGTTTNEYDTSDRVISQTDPAGRTLSFEYGTSNGGTPETKITNHATGAVTDEVFDDGYELTSIIREPGLNIGTHEERAYDGAADLIEVVDGNAHATEYGYDGEGNNITEIDADKHETKWTYDGTHDVVTATTPDGETTRIKRDTHGNPEVIERPAPGSKTQLTKYDYNSLGELESITDPLERTWKYEYDSQGDRTGEIDPENARRTWEYNGDSQPVVTVSPRGNVTGGEPAKYTTKTERDQQGRPLTVTDALGHKTKYTYNGNGDLETLTDPAGDKTKYTYDADNELTKVEQPNATATETGYDGAGRVISQTDGNKHTTKYVRNVFEQVQEIIDPKERKTVKGYDEAGNLTILVDAAGRRTTYTYDPANRLTEVSYSDEKTHAIKYEYNGDGARTHISDGSGETSYAYDQLDRMSESKDGHGDVAKYEYDLANELAKITYPNGKAVTRAYDKDGRLEKVTDWLEHATKFAYDPDSDLATTTFPSGTSNVDSYAYNEADQMSEVKMSKGTETLASLAYTRDSDGQLKTTTSKGLPGEESLGYTYDPNNRLTKGGAIGYEYDAADNTTKVGTGSYTYDKADELEAGPSAKYAYNEVGERSKLTPSTGAATTYTYDEPGNLIAIEKPKEGKVAGFTDTFTYDGNGLRVSQTIAKTTTYLAWQMNEAIPLILNDGTNSYIYGPDGLPVEQISSGGTVTYLHHDQQGSTRLITSATGAKEAAVTYDAYGNTTGTTGTAKTPLGYDGQYTSSDTGLIYMRARVYDPATAQFLSVDPLDAITSEPYEYGGDNPVANVDPTGTSLCLFGYCLGFHPVNPVKAVANFGAGFANAVVSTATLGNVHISAPFCGPGLNWSYGIGGITAGAEAAVLTPDKYEKFFRLVGLGPAASPILAGGLTGAGATFVASGGEASVTQEVSGFGGGLFGGLGGNVAGSLVYTPSRAATSAAGGLVSSWLAEAALPAP